MTTLNLQQKPSKELVILPDLTPLPLLLEIFFRSGPLGFHVSHWLLQLQLHSYEVIHSHLPFTLSFSTYTQAFVLMLCFKNHFFPSKQRLYKTEIGLKIHPPIPIFESTKIRGEKIKIIFPSFTIM